MNPNVRTIALLFALAAPVVIAAKPVERKDLPPAVQKTIARELEGATLKGISTEKCLGKICYEIETMRGAKSRDFVVDEAGVVVEAEDEIDPADLPQPVQAAAAKLGTVVRVEKLTKQGVVAFEVTLKAGNKKLERTFLPDGTIKN